MALVFSPLSEDILASAPRRLHPGHAFLLRQIGGPPAIDERITEIVREVFDARGFPILDADASTGGGDFLERILGLIRATGFTVAIFSHDTRPDAMANITLELGFAAMCGKPLMIIKSQAARIPSDFTRTDWIPYDAGDEDRFRRKVEQALDMIEDAAAFQELTLDIALEARSIDCAVAFERANKAFLLSKDRRILEKVEEVQRRLAAAGGGNAIDDLERLKAEIAMFLKLARVALDNPRAAPA